MYCLDGCLRSSEKSRLSIQEMKKLCKTKMNKVSRILSRANKDIHKDVDPYIWVRIIASGSLLFFYISRPLYGFLKTYLGLGRELSGGLLYGSPLKR